jgi:hypothetical protein
MCEGGEEGDVCIRAEGKEEILELIIKTDDLSFGEWFRDPV